MPESAKSDGTAGSFTKLSDAFLNMDLRQAVASYLDLLDNVTQQVLEFQESSLKWAKETPLEPFVEFKTSITRKLAETSISAVRNLYQIQTESR